VRGCADWRGWDASPALGRTLDRMRWLIVVVLTGTTAAACVCSSAAPTRPVDKPRPASLGGPLHFPQLTAGERCPRTSGGLRAKGVAIALGRGPVYPVLGMAAAPPAARGVAGLRSDFHVLGWYLHKTLWAISPDYSGPILVRGERLDDPGPVRFGAGAATPRGSVRDSKPNLRQPADTAREWRYLPGFTLLRGSGCYGFQIDGVGFSQVVVFSASTTSN
jgi:hypothetical protein